MLSFFKIKKLPTFLLQCASQQNTFQIEIQIVLLLSNVNLSFTFLIPDYDRQIPRALSVVGGEIKVLTFQRHHYWPN